jgi:hypothetical protein
MQGGGGGRIGGAARRRGRRRGAAQGASQRRMPATARRGPGLEAGVQACRQAAPRQAPPHLQLARVLCRVQRLRHHTLGVVQLVLRVQHVRQRGGHLGDDDGAGLACGTCGTGEQGQGQGLR